MPGYEVLTDAELDIAIAEAKLKDQGQQALSDQELDTLINARQPTGPGQGVTLSERFKVKVLLDNDPESASEFLQRQGYETRFIDGDLQVKKPDEQAFKAVDPEGFEAQDILDLFGDALEFGVDAIATGAKAVGMITAGPPGLATGAGLGGLAAGGFETARQAAAIAAGAREELDPGRIGERAALGAAIPFGLGALGKGAQKVAKKGLEKLAKGIDVKDAARVIPEPEEVLQAAKVLDTPITPAQVSQSRAVRALESIEFAEPTTAGKLVSKRARDLPKTVAKQQDQIALALDDIAATSEGKSLFEASGTAVDEIKEVIATKQAQASSLFEQFEKPAKLIRTSNATKNQLKAKIDELIEFNKFDATQVKALENLKGNVDNIKHLADIKKFNTAVGNLGRRQEISGAGLLQQTIGDIEQEAFEKSSKQIAAMTNSDAKTIQSALQEGRAIYKEAIDDLNKVLNIKKKAGVSPVKQLEEFIERSGVERTALKGFDAKNIERLNQFKSRFPEAFEEIRQRKLTEFFAKSERAVEGKTRALNPSAVVNNFKKLERDNKEVANILFGEDAKMKIKAIGTLLDAAPTEFRNVSKSGDVIAMRGMFSNIIGQVGAMTRAKLLDFVTNPTRIEADKIIQGALPAVRPIPAAAKQVAEERLIEKETEPKSLRREFLRQK
jgi:hypothetical protein